MPDLIWLLLPIAAYAGWYAAGHRNRKPASHYPETLLGPEYFKGLNHLLNEQPDKAIDVFIRMLEVTADTFETHLALGALFRRRGEVNRAIRIHQNLVSRESLSTEQRAEALYELGQDYLRAGLLGRAENLFIELAASADYRQQVLPGLLDIYQQEKDWEKAINIVGQMKQVDGQSVDAVCAQFHCEQAMAAFRNIEAGNVRACVQAALARDASCARANIILGNLEHEAADNEAALAAYERVVEQDSELLPEVLQSMVDCHRQAGTVSDLIAYLDTVIPRYPGIAPVLMQAECLATEKGNPVAAEFLLAQLEEQPSVYGLARLIELGLAGCEGPDDAFLRVLRQLIDELQQNSVAYSCSECGFTGKALHWQCPGCKHWNTVRSVHGVMGI